MNIVSRGYTISLNQEEERFINKLLDFIDNIETELFDSNVVIPDELQAILTDLRDNACKLRDNEFYDKGD